MRAMVSDFFVYINVLFSIVHLKLICHVNVPSVLLSKSADYFTKLSHHGLMTQKEAGNLWKELRRSYMSYQVAASSSIKTSLMLK